MSKIAEVKNEKGVKESNGMNYLDLLKHCVKTIISGLSDGDRFSLVSYSSRARIEYNLEYMTSENKENVIDALERLRTEYSTNIWDGLKTALDICNDKKEKDKNQTVLLITDGEPNVHPTGGIVSTFEKYVKTLKYCPIVNTYSFGK